ncbi:MAG: VOC family protein [Candidatus Hydrothermae bacterium]|nr:VOC family protein [Candidatus Hydrothermae bacterium]
MKLHSFCHIEWWSTDLEKTRKLLEGLFGWEFQSLSEDYLVFSTPEGPGGGIFKAEEVNPGSSPLVYILVDHIAPYLEKAEKLGGTIDVPETEIPGVGRYAHIKDHDGNIYGLFAGQEG